MKIREDAVNRRDLIKTTLWAGGGLLAGSTMLGNHSGLGHSLSKPEGLLQQRPLMPWGVQLGDISSNGVTLWSATDRPAELMVEVADNESFARALRFKGSFAWAEQDFTARINLQDLPPAELLYYRTSFRDMDNSGLSSEAVLGSFRPIAQQPQRIRFCFSGDTAGQGWGINQSFGGMKIYESIRQRKPDFFIHCGDTVYADGPLSSEVILDDGRVWQNLVTEAKSKVAESLQEFRGNYQYNMLDLNVRRFNAEIPQLVQWDDHETVNNWYPQELLEDPRYQEKNAAVLASRARTAFLEYSPINPIAVERQQIYRSLNYGKLLDIFMIDLRSYRGPNSLNQQSKRSPEADILGKEQMDWLKLSLASSKARWKVISSDMPLGLIVPDGPENQEGIANGNGPALGRELEIAELLQFIMEKDIKNVIWITADVHYAAAHFYQPRKAQFKNFKPFWEFVSGPLHAGTFGPNTLDNTFGPEVRWQSIPDGLKPNRSPLDGYQFFGEIEVDAQSQTMKVRQFNIDGQEVFFMEVPLES